MICCMQCCISVSADFVVRGCAVCRRYINVCNGDVFSVVNVYLDHLRLCVVCIYGRWYVCCYECNISNECDEPTPALCNLSVRTVVKLCTLGVFTLGVTGQVGLGVGSWPSNRTTEGSNPK